MTYWELTQSATCLRHFRCEETGGSIAIDSSPNPQKGVYQGSPPTVPGRYGAGRGLATGLALRADGLQINQLTSCTLAVWIKWTNTTSSQTVFASQGANRPFMFASTRNHEIGLLLNDRGGFFGSGVFPSGWIDGQWRHLAVTCDSQGGTSRFYVDGVVAGVVPQEFLSDSNGVLYAGNRLSTNGADQPAGEAIDDILVFDRALSDAEIGELAAGPEPTLLASPTLQAPVTTGEPVGRNTGTWETHDNGPVSVTSLLQAEGATPDVWHDIPGSEAGGFALPATLAEKRVRLAATAINNGGSSLTAYSVARTVAQAMPLRFLAAQSVATSGAVATDTKPPSRAAAITFTNAGSLP